MKLIVASVLLAFVGLVAARDYPIFDRSCSVRREELRGSVKQAFMASSVSV
jgi:hypothetical protein